jgi:hypothetical protein
MIALLTFPWLNLGLPEEKAASKIGWFVIMSHIKAATLGL